jgi:aspartate-semialdehyde dehydrogenase
MIKKIGVYGANGIVGQLMLKELARIPAKHEIKTFGRNDAAQETDIAVLCTDDAVSAELLPAVSQKTKFIVDMSAKFRMDAAVPLVIPEVNAHTITKNTRLIASPNCTITGLTMALNALKKDYALEEVFFCSYQAISGGGKKLLEEYRGEKSIYQANCVPLIGSMQANGFTSEEVKGINEIRKILDLPNIKVRPHTTRVPVEVGHSLGATIKAKEVFDLEKVSLLLGSHSGIICDGKVYTQKDSAGTDNVYVSRLRVDAEDKNILYMWVTLDNLLKGAALNGRQIVQYLLENFLND